MPSILTDPNAASPCPLPKHLPLSAAGASDFPSLSFLKGSLSSRSFSCFTPSSQWIKAVTYSRVTSGPDSLLWLQILGNFIQRNDFRYFCFLITLNPIPSTLTCSKNSKHIHLIAAFQWVPLGIGNLTWSKQISRFVPRLSTMAFSLIFSHLPFFLPCPTLPSHPLSATMPAPPQVSPLSPASWLPPQPKFQFPCKGYSHSFSIALCVWKARLLLT